MSSSLNITDTEVLSNLRNALSSFSEKTQENTASIQIELQRTLEWIDERVQYWRSEVERAEARVDEAMEESRGEYGSEADDEDDYTDYSDGEDVLEEATRELEKCQENLETAERWRDTLEDAVEEYYRSMTGFYTMVTDHTEGAKAFLSEKLTKYVLVHASGKSDLSSLGNYDNHINSTIGSSCRLTPVGGLSVHEYFGGHLIKSHVEKTEIELSHRLASESNIPAASSFSTREIAESSVLETLIYNKDNITSFLNGSRFKKIIDHKLPYSIGICIPRDDKIAKQTNKIRVVLVKNKLSPTGYIVRTAYPIL